MQYFIIHQDALQRQFNQTAVHFLRDVGVIKFPYPTLNTGALIVILTIYVLSFAAET